MKLKKIIIGLLIIACIGVGFIIYVKSDYKAIMNQINTNAVVEIKDCQNDVYLELEDASDLINEMKLIQYDGIKFSNQPIDSKEERAFFVKVYDQESLNTFVFSDNNDHSGIMGSKYYYKIKNYDNVYNMCVELMNNN